MYQKFSSKNSPLRNSGRNNNFDDFGTNNFLESSFRNQNPTNNIRHNTSHGSNSIDHVNTYGRNQGVHQYSPAGSQNNHETESHYNRSHRTNTVQNVDDIPITTTKAKTFEELLESNLRQLGMDAVPPQSDNDDYGQQDNSKKEFLKRKSKKQAIAPAPPKKYNYYVDNFDEQKKKERDNTTSQHNDTTIIKE